MIPEGSSVSQCHHGRQQVKGLRNLVSRAVYYICRCLCLLGSWQGNFILNDSNKDMTVRSQHRKRKHVSQLSMAVTKGLRKSTYKELRFVLPRGQVALFLWACGSIVHHGGSHGIAKLLTSWQPKSRNRERK